MTPDDRIALHHQLIDHEGVRLRVYRDPVGKETIGIGRNLVDRGISGDEAMLLLDHDLDDCEADLQAFGWFTALDPVRRRVMLELRFNLGLHRLLLFVRMLDALARQDYAAAALELATSAWASQVQPSRAECLVRQLRTGIA